MQIVPIGLQKRRNRWLGSFSRKNKKPSFYKNKIVIIPDLNLSEDVFYLKKPQGNYCPTRRNNKLWRKFSKKIRNFLFCFTKEAKIYGMPMP